MKLGTQTNSANAVSMGLSNFFCGCYGRQYCIATVFFALLRKEINQTEDNKLSNKLFEIYSEFSDHICITFRLLRKLIPIAIALFAQLRRVINQSEHTKPQLRYTLNSVNIPYMLSCPVAKDANFLSDSVYVQLGRDGCQARHTYATTA